MVNNTPKEFSKDADKSGVHLQKKLTPAEAEVLHLISVEFLTPSQISRRRRCSRSAVSNILASLRKKGVLSKVNTTPVNNTYTPQGTVHHPVRLHGERYRIKLISSGHEYVRARQRANSIILDGNRVVLYRDSLMIFSFQSFFGESCDECEHKAVDYWLRFFVKLEGHLKIKILKPRSQNIKQVFFHFAESGNELAQELRKKKQKLRVFGTEDGKEWLLFDDSNKLEEAETTRPPTAVRTAKDDMSEVVQPFFNDLRDNQKTVLLPSQVAQTISQTALFVRENAATLQSILKLIEAVMPQESPQQMTEEGRPPYVG